MKLERSSGVWVDTAPPRYSAERIIAQRIMPYFDKDPNDFRQRDPIIMEISDIVTALMNAAYNAGRRSKP